MGQLDVKSPCVICANDLSGVVPRDFDRGCLTSHQACQPAKGHYGAPSPPFMIDLMGPWAMGPALAHFLSVLSFSLPSAVVCHCMLLGASAPPVASGLTWSTT
jgi:hypothetical protein